MAASSEHSAAKLAAKPNRDIDNKQGEANDGELEWSDDGGSRITSSSKATSGCFAQAGAMNGNEDLYDGNGLFPGAINGTTCDVIVSTMKEKQCFFSEAQSNATVPIIVSDELRGHDRKPFSLKESDQTDDAIAVIGDFNDHLDDSMEEETLNEHKTQEAQEYSCDDADNDALSTTNNHSGLSTTTASSMNIQEADFDYDMGGLYSTVAGEPFRSAIASLTPESSASSPVLNPLMENSQDDNNNCAMEVIEEQNPIVVTTKKETEKIGRVGLSNLGNTCFMNSTLQCLAHTDLLREYFVSGSYKEHLNVDNPLGTGGDLATEFSDLLALMWSTKTCSTETSSSLSYSYRYNSSYASNNCNVVYPRNFKYALGKHAEQFIGYDQHDSQELATYLLDALHEDTNRVTKKPYVEKPEQNLHESDDDAATKAWAVHLQREDSFVTRTFVGQVKSKVTCPVVGCGRVSTTYDPFMYLSVPIPGTSDVTLNVTFVPLDPTKNNEHISLTVPKSVSVSTYLEKLSEVVSVTSENLIVADIFKHEVYELFQPSDPITKLCGNVDIYVYHLKSLASIQQQQQARESVSKQESCSSFTSCRSSPDETLHNDPESCFSQDLSLPVATTQYYDDEYQWTNAICNHTSEVIFNRLRNIKRSTHQDRMEFLAKLETYLVQEKARFLNCGQEIGKLSRDADDSPLILTSQSLPSPSISIFHGTDNMTSVLTLEYCGEKFRQWCMNTEAEKQKSLQGGVIIQVFMQQEEQVASHPSFGSKNLFTLPLIMRIPRSMTVFELRMEIGKRLSRALEVIDLIGAVLQDAALLPAKTLIYNGHECGNESTKKPKISSKSELNVADFSSLVMTGIPISYQNTNQSPHTRTHLLGCIQSESDNLPWQRVVVANADNAEESEVVSGLIGRDSGRVFLQFSRRSKCYNFNVEKWEYVAPSATQDDMHDAVCKNRMNLLSCIEKYCQKEQLEKSEMWFCNRCQAHVRAWKHIHLYRTPPILIIHLKRFHYSASTHHRDKIDVLVDFPLKGLDLTDFVLHRDGEEKAIYDCFAVSNHYGGLGGGHYTAYALNHGQWCHFDDSVVSVVDDSEVVSKAAYVLYYCRRQNKTARSCDARLALDSEFLSYSFSPVSITTDASSRGSLDELDAPYPNESNAFAV